MNTLLSFNATTNVVTNSTIGSCTSDCRPEMVDERPMKRGDETNCREFENDARVQWATILACHFKQNKIHIFSYTYPRTSRHLRFQENLAEWLLGTAITLSLRSGNLVANSHRKNPPWVRFSGMLLPNLPQSLEFLLLRRRCHRRGRECAPVSSSRSPQAVREHTRVLHVHRERIGRV